MLCFIYELTVKELWIEHMHEDTVHAIPNEVLFIRSRDMHTEVASNFSLNACIFYEAFKNHAPPKVNEFNCYSCISLYNCHYLALNTPNWICSNDTDKTSVLSYFYICMVLVLYLNIFVPDFEWEQRIFWYHCSHEQTKARYHPLNCSLQICNIPEYFYKLSICRIGMSRQEVRCLICV